MCKHSSALDLIIHRMIFLYIDDGYFNTESFQTVPSSLRHGQIKTIV